jgi:hypothetical protein
MLAISIANIVLTIWAVHRTLKNQHSLNAFASKLRWAIVFLGGSEFFCCAQISGNRTFRYVLPSLVGLPQDYFCFSQMQHIIWGNGSSV